MQIIITFILYVPFLLLTALAQGYVGYVMYHWFIFPFYDVPDLSIWKMIGILLFVRFVTNPLKNSDIDNDSGMTDEEVIERDLKRLFLGLVNPWLVLLSAWIIHLVFF